ncbi:MAG: hypothetical protein GY947_23175 [Rhodobacteraceae bacterium]|nr:hypothetical protein [Paracoccaceae bacterium]
MPCLDFHPELNASAERVLVALGSIGEFENFIPGCKQSAVLTCNSVSENTWEGTARYAFELKKYAIYEEAFFDFRVDGNGRTVRFEVCETETSSFSAIAIYSIEEQGPNRCSVNVAIEYDVPGKKYFWVMAKPLIGRFFQKFVGLIEKRAQRLNDNAQISFSTSQGSGKVDTSVRGFRQLDERTYEARMKLLDQFSSGSVGAEVGTYMGAFAQLIVDTVKPTKLYLIDPWIASNSESQAGSWYETVDQNYMDDVFHMVSQRFSNGANISNVNIIRDYSSSALKTLEDGELDWIYIDGDHSYDAVLKDLKLSFDKVRSGGFISGDDYEVVETWWKDNVVRAVTEFVDAYRVEFVLQEGSQFLLRKR